MIFRPLDRLRVIVPPWAWLVAVAAGLRLVNLGGESLWYDEAGTLLTVKLPFDKMLQAVSNDVHPPLWYIVEWINIRLFGTGEFAFRLPAALLSILAVLLVWRIALCCLDKRGAFLAGLIAAILPASVYYGQDARMYPLLAVCVLGALLAVIRDNYLLFFVCALGAIDAQYVGLFYIGALGLVWVMKRCGPFAFFYKLVVFDCVFLAWAPWMRIFFAQVTRVQASFWIQPVNPGLVLTPLATMTFGDRFPFSLILFFGGVAFALTLLGIAAARTWPFNRAILFAGAFGAPLAIAAFSAVFQRSIYLPRALLPSALLLAVFWAAGLRQLNVEDRRAALVIGLPILVLGLFFHYFPGERGRFPSRDWATTVQSQWQPGDVVYNLTEGSSVPYGVYLGGWPGYLMPDGSHLAQGGLTAETRDLLGFQQATFDQVAASGAYQRAWLTVGSSPTLPASANQAAVDILGHYRCAAIRSASNAISGTTLYVCELALEL